MKNKLMMCAGHDSCTLIPKNMFGTYHFKDITDRVGSRCNICSASFCVFALTHRDSAVTGVQKFTESNHEVYADPDPDLDNYFCAVCAGQNLGLVRVPTMEELGYVWELSSRSSG